MDGQLRVAVVGSVNMDVVSQVQAFPQAGETVHASATTFHSGGKGANQAVAAAAAGAIVDFIGAVGDDAFAEPLATGLAARGISVEALAHKRMTSGQAFITVDASGQNTIVLSAGANGQVTASEVEAAQARIARASVTLTQNEIPWEATLAALTLGHQAGARVFANPAPAFELPAEAYALIDTLILNEVESATLTHRAVATLADAEQAAGTLLERGARAVIVTLGALGSLYLDSSGQRIETPIFPVPAVDTTAAGDTFIGMYAVAAAQMRPAEALRFATAASALCVSRRGAQESIPMRGEVEAFLRSH
ncbi:MAG TPA: ribokinase [Ktedonobacterales bacterium]|nr:ribokinase [Ktedonobacterales bacterium]